MAIQTLTINNQTGIFPTTVNVGGVMSAIGTFGPNVRINVGFAHNEDGDFAGLTQFQGPFAETITFPGAAMKFWLVNPLDITNIDIDVTEP